MNLWAQAPVSWGLSAAVRVCWRVGAGQGSAQTGKTGPKQGPCYVPVAPQVPGRLASSPVAGSLRDRQTRHGGQGRPGPQPARSGPQVAPRGCGCGSLAAPAAAGVSAGLFPACVSVTAAVSPSFTGHPHPPCVLGTPGVAPRPSEAKAQTERATRGGNRGVQWGCAVPGIPACGVHGRGVGVLAGVLCWAGDSSFVSPTPPPKAPGGGDDLPRSKPWCPCV